MTRSDSSEEADQDEPLVHRLYRTLGRVEQRLDTGQEFHHEVKEKLDDHEHRLTIVEQRQPEGGSSGIISLVRDILELLKEMWPILLPIAVAAARYVGFDHGLDGSGH